MQKLVFFVGPDMCGKTQIAKHVARYLRVPYFKASDEHNSYLSKKDRFINQLRYADMRVFDVLKQTGQSVVFDRGYPCEWVYSQVFERETDMDVLKLEDESYASLGATIILCHRSSYAGIVDDIDPRIENHVLCELHDAYFDFAKWTKCRLLKVNVDDEDLERETREIVDFVRNGETE